MQLMLMDTMSVFGAILKMNLQHVAKRISLLKQTPYSIIINRIRMRLSVILMQHNADMMIASFYL